MKVTCTSTSAHCKIFLPPSPAVHPAESGSCGTILVCVRCPDSSWVQSGSLHSMEAVPQSQSAEGCIALEGRKDAGWVMLQCLHAMQLS